MGNGRQHLGLVPGHTGRRTKASTKSTSTNGDYVEFTDKAVTSGYDVGFAYEGYGESTRKFFKENSNAMELLSGLSSDEKNAFRRWTEGHFMHGQQYRGFKNMSREDQEYTRIYDKILDQSKLNQGIVVHRLAGFELINNGSSAHLSLAQLQKLKGKYVVSDGNMSTAAAAEGLTIGGSYKSVDYKISIPKDSVGAGMWVGEKSINGWGPRQREFMMNRDLGYEIGNSYYDPATKRYIVELTFVDRRKHKYN